jgi:hypothetical protein
MDPTDGLEAIAHRKMFCPCWEPNPGRYARSVFNVLTEKPQHIFVGLLFEMEPAGNVFVRLPVVPYVWDCLRKPGGMHNCAVFE